MEYEKITLKLVLILLFAGIISYFGTMLMGSLMAIPMWAIISGIVVVGALVYIKGFVELDNIDFFDAIILLVLVGVIGTVVNTIMPGASSFILSLAEFNALGLGWTLLYIALGEVVVNKIM